VILEGLGPPRWWTPDTFDDPMRSGRRSANTSWRRRRQAAGGPLLSGERGRVKTKNRDYWRYEMEREGAFKVKRQLQFV
jgi:hypothetical protein